MPEGNFFDQNALLFQYLMAAGQDIGSGNPAGSNVANVFNQNLQTQKYAKLLQTLLSGGGKVTMDKENVNIKAPTSAFQPEPKAALGPGITPNTVDPTTQARAGSLVPQPMSGAQPKQQDQSGLLSSLLKGNLGDVNPSSSPLSALSKSDLAGLTPQDVSQALNFKFKDVELGRATANDVINNLHKVSLIQQAQQAATIAERRTAIAELAEMRQWEEAIKQSPLSVPGLGQLSLDTWEKLPTDVKAYSYYTFNAKQNNEKVLSFKEFKSQADPSSLVQYYNLGKADPEFKNWLMKYNESKRSTTNINIGEQVKKKEALSWVDYKNELSENLEKHMIDPDTQIKINRSDNPKRTAAAERMEFIARGLIARGAKPPAGKDEIEVTKKGTVVTFHFSDSEGNERKQSYDVGY